MASTIGEFPPSFTQRQLCVHLLGVRERQSVRSIATHAYGGTQLCTGQIVCVCVCVCEGGGVVTHCLETLQNVIHDSDYCRAAVCHITGACVYSYNSVGRVECVCASEDFHKVDQLAVFAG